MEQQVFNQIMELKKQNKLLECVDLYKNAIDNGDDDARIFAGLGKVFYLQQKYKQAMYSNFIYFNLVLSFHGTGHIVHCHSQAFHLFMIIINNPSICRLMESGGVFNDKKVLALCNSDYEYALSLRGEATSHDYVQLMGYFLNEQPLALKHTMGFVLSRVKNNLNLPMSELLKIYPIFEE